MIINHNGVNMSIADVKMQNEVLAIVLGTSKNTSLKIDKPNIETNQVVVKKPRYNHKRTYKAWTKDEEQFILLNHKLVPAKFLAKKLGRTAQSVSMRIYDLLNNKLSYAEQLKNSVGSKPVEVKVLDN